MFVVFEGCWDCANEYSQEEHLESFSSVYVRRSPTKAWSTSIHLLFFLRKRTDRIMPVKIGRLTSKGACCFERRLWTYP